MWFFKVLWIHCLINGDCSYCDWCNIFNFTPVGEFLPLKTTIQYNAAFVIHSCTCISGWFYCKCHEVNKFKMWAIHCSPSSIYTYCQRIGNKSDKIDQLDKGKLSWCATKFSMNITRTTKQSVWRFEVSISCLGLERLTFAN